MFSHNVLMKKHLKLAFCYTMAMIVTTGMLLFFSYSISKHEALKLVGSSINYFPKLEVKITSSQSHYVYPSWIFSFSHRRILDAGFDIQVNFIGEIVHTNPDDLKQRLREFENGVRHHGSPITGSGWTNELFTLNALNVRPWLVNLESTFPAAIIMS